MSLLFGVSVCVCVSIYIYIMGVKHFIFPSGKSILEHFIHTHTPQTVNGLSFITVTGCTKMFPSVFEYEEKEKEVPMPPPTLAVGGFQKPRVPAKARRPSHTTLFHDG